ncbi:hypothetical protein BOTBODRAFT_178478 [Botryobasidium botryosum FD-172 SS1]|uniref:SEC7 domain-containing protein n=1 Tax=Botryobasidium botryosum (strain FD-172 SS1) TaxID=930990 RepID=A0A067MDY9_BOTB1|nr:hypothetical protein BOTBODRAFT_178478 [Botryobasidium botryosum FD-172 SS1]
MSNDPSPADVRAVAVAKLKRAASLPRMKDGRRPPMHGDAVSEGEKPSAVQDLFIANGRTPPNDDVLALPDIKDDILSKISTPAPSTAPSPIPPTSNQPMPEEPSYPEDFSEDVKTSDEREAPTPPPVPTGKKKRTRSRSRSRSRSRTSKDLRDIAQSSGPESSNEDPMPPVPLPALYSPSPSYQQLGLPRVPMQFTPSVSPLPFFHPPTSPPTPLPSLDAIRGGLLMRSNSAAARMVALNKLTGGTETPEPARSPTPSHASPLGRSNTVTGLSNDGDRMAARSNMLRQLGKRRVRDADGELTSGGEDVVLPHATPPPPRTPSRFSSRKRSGSNASPSNPIVDDREPPTDAPNSPAGPSTPLPPPPDPSSFAHFLHPPRALSPASSTQERERDSALARLVGEDSFEYDAHLRQSPASVGRNHHVVVEEDEGDELVPPLPSPSFHHPPNHSPQIPFQLNLSSPGSSSRFGTPSFQRSPHAPDAPSTASSISAGDSIPVFFGPDGQASPYGEDAFPVAISPFGTPMKDQLKEEEEEEGEEEGEQVVYPEELKAPWSGRPDNEFDLSVPSWVGIDEPGMGDDDDEEEEEDGEEEDETTQLHPAQDVFLPARPTPSPNSSNNISSPSPETPLSSLMPHSPMAPSHFSSDATPTRMSNMSMSSGMPLSSATTSQLIDRSRSQSIADWEESPVEREADAPRDPKERNRERESKGHKKGEGSTSKWDSFKNTITGRSGSALGRRSRSNSIVNVRRDDKTDSSAASRESGASGGSGKMDQRSNVELQLQVPGSHGSASLMPPKQLAPSASSASLLSLAAAQVSPPRGGVSPIPPVKPDRIAMYTDPKLMAFPGIVKLEEERRTRARGQSISSSTMITPVTSSSDITPTTANGVASSASTTPAIGPEGADASMPRTPDPDRSFVSHQASDSQLLARYQASMAAKEMASPSAASQSSQTTAMPGDVERGRERSPGHSRADTLPYFDLPLPSGASASSGKLPTTREGVKKWLKLFSSQTSLHSPQTNAVVSSSASVSNLTVRGHNPRRPSLTDILRKGGENSNEDDRSLSPPKNSPTKHSHKKSMSRDERREIVHTPSMELSADPFAASPPTVAETTNRVTSLAPSQSTMTSDRGVSMDSFAMRVPASPVEMVLPSLDSSQSSGSPSAVSTPSDTPNTLPQKSVDVLHKVDLLLSQNPQNGAGQPMPLDDPPRKLLLTTPVLQIVNQNTVKDRFLFLFSDILVIAKPIQNDSTRDALKPSMDRKYVVKNIIELHNIQLSIPKDESSRGSGGPDDWRQWPSVKLFVKQFSSNPEHAITSLLEKTRLKDDPVNIGNLLFKAVDLDRTQLGEFLSRRSSKAILKTFIDRFAFTGVRIDEAMRIFLLSIRLPADPAAVEHTLSMFASRWFEANNGVVSFDKELTTRLVFAMMQLNDALHSGFQTESAANVVSFPNQGISAHDFIEAFRIRDSRTLVSDKSLERIYESVRKEKLAPALDSSSAHMLIPATLTPSRISERLTTRVPSDVITIKIPRPDANFSIRLLGQDLDFEPPVLSFATSCEASFRIIGHKLGSKTAIFQRVGSNAALYTGLPLSKTFQVERAFMRHTFTVGFHSTLGVKRKYMFSVDDRSVHQHWVSILRTQITRSVMGDDTSDSRGLISVRTRRAAEAVALQVLRDALISPEDTAAMAEAPHGSSLLQPQPQRNTAPANAPTAATAAAAATATAGDQSADSFSQMRGAPSSGHDLVLICQQNSLIPLILSFLHAVKPADEQQQPQAAEIGMGAGPISGAASYRI